MTNLLFSDGTEANDDFIMRQGDDAYLDVHGLDRITKADRDLSAYPEIIWELEGVEFQIRKTKSAGQITHPSSNIARIAIDQTDSEGLHGLYTHQLRVINTAGEKETILSGAGRFDREVFGSVAA